MFWNNNDCYYRTLLALVVLWVVLVSSFNVKCQNKESVKAWLWTPMPILSKHPMNVNKYLFKFMRHMVLYSAGTFIMGIQRILYVFLGHGDGGISYLRDYSTFANSLVRIYILFCKQRWIKLWNKWTSFHFCELKWFNQIFFKLWFFQPECHFQQRSLRVSDCWHVWVPLKSPHRD